MVAWAIVWFVLGYALIATAFGALGSLGSRPEDASSLTSPLIVVLIAGYFISFAAIGSPDTWWARLACGSPPPRPLPCRTGSPWGPPPGWDPYLAVLLTCLPSSALSSSGAASTPTRYCTAAEACGYSTWRGSPTGSTAAGSATPVAGSRQPGGRCGGGRWHDHHAESRHHPRDRRRRWCVRSGI